MRWLSSTRRLSLFAGVTLVFGAAAPPTFSGEIILAQIQPSIDCTCRYKGQDFQQGDMVCLSSPDGPQLAKCGFVLNNTSWNFTGMGCLYSSTDQYIPRAAGYSMLGPAMTKISIQ